MHSPSTVSDHIYETVRADLENTDPSSVPAQSWLRIDWTLAFSLLEGAQEALLTADTETERAIRLEECKVRMVSNVFPAHVVTLR